MKASAITSATAEELHALHNHLMQINPKTGKRLDSASAVFLALVLVVDQRLEELCRAIKNIQPVKVDLLPPPVRNKAKRRR